MNRIVSLDPVNVVAVIEPGVSQQQLRDQLGEQGVPLTLGFSRGRRNIRGTGKRLPPQEVANSFVAKSTRESEAGGACGSPRRGGCQSSSTGPRVTTLRGLFP